jgi:hypothetical protein
VVQHPVINMMSKNSAVLAAACPGSVARVRTDGMAFEAAALTYAHASAAAFAQAHGKQVLASVKESGKALAFLPANGDLRRDEQPLGNGVLSGVRDVQAQVDEQRWSVPSGTSLIAPTARMATTKRGVSGPYPWRQPV